MLGKFFSEDTNCTSLNYGPLKKKRKFQQAFSVQGERKYWELYSLWCRFSILLLGDSSRKQHKWARAL